CIAAVAVLVPVLHGMEYLAGQGLRRLAAVDQGGGQWSGRVPLMVSVRNTGYLSVCAIAAPCLGFVAVVRQADILVAVDACFRMAHCRRGLWARQRFFVVVFGNSGHRTHGLPVPG